MAFDVRPNLATSLVATAPSPATSGTSLVVTAGEGTRFSGFPFYAIVHPDGSYPTPGNGEIVRITAQATDTLTITRAQQSTTARAIAVGDRISVVLTQTDIEAIQAWQASDGSIVVPQVDSPAVPAAGFVDLFGRRIGGSTGRILPAFIGPSGLDSALQPLLGRNKVMWANPVAGAATLNVMGVTITATGTATLAAAASTSLHTSLSRIDYLVTAASNSAVAGWRQSTNSLWLGNAAGLGGFTALVRWSPATGQATTTSRHFVGIGNSTAAPTDVEPSTITNIIGVGWDAADTNMQMMWRGTGAVTKTDLGSSFAVPTTDRPGVWELALFSAPNSGVVNYAVTNLGTGAVAQGQITTNLPTNTTFMSARGWASVGGTSSVIGTTLFGLYVETDL